MVVSCPHTFSIGSHNSYPWLQENYSPRPEIYPQNLSTQYLVVWGSKKQQKRGWDYSNFTKGEAFLVS